ncbi:C-type lectin BpLec-like [Branchiostoma floridae x Branchiostoma belcheri]
MDCWMEGATLAMPKTEELDVALRDLVKTEGGNKQHWIGMEEKDRTWYWVDGSVVGDNGYKGWNPGEPDYYRWPRCGQYWSGRTGYPMWDDEGCHRVMRRFICQRPPS